VHSVFRRLLLTENLCSKPGEYLMPPLEFSPSSFFRFVVPPPPLRRRPQTLFCAVGPHLFSRGSEDSAPPRPGIPFPFSRGASFVDSFSPLGQPLSRCWRLPPPQGLGRPWRPLSRKPVCPRSPWASLFPSSPAGFPLNHGVVFVCYGVVFRSSPPGPFPHPFGGVFFYNPFCTHPSFTSAQPLSSFRLPGPTNLLFSPFSSILLTLPFPSSFFPSPLRFPSLFLSPAFSRVRAPFSFCEANPLFRLESFLQHPFFLPSVGFAATATVYPDP